MKNKKIKFIILSVIIAIVGLFFFDREQILAGFIRNDETTQVQEGVWKTYDFFASSTIGVVPTSLATTTSATSTNIASYTDVNGRIDNGYFIVQGAKKVEMLFKRGDTSGQGNVGTSTFNIQVSPDGTNWFYWNRMLELTSTSTDSVLTSSKPYSSVIFSASANYNNATGTKMMALDLTNDTIYAIRCIVVEGTDGEHTCKGFAQY